MFENFKQANAVRCLHRWVQVFLALSLIAVLNYICFHYFIRKDLTKGARHSLSAETLFYIKHLQSPVRFIMTRPPQGQSRFAQQSAEVFDQAHSLLKEFVYASQTQGNRNLSLEFIDIYRQRDKLEDIAKKYQPTLNNDQFMMAVGSFGHQQIHPEELYRQLSDQTVVFNGEIAFTKALIQTSSPRQNKIYFTKGHGEMNPNDTRELTGLSAFRDFLEQRGYLVHTIDLTHARTIPEDAHLLIVAAPKFELLGDEQQTIRKWLNEQQGRALFLIEPDYDHGLGDLFYEWGILSDDRLIIETSPQNITSTGDLIIENYTQHPIVQLLQQQHLKILMGRVRPIRPHLGTPPDSNLHSQSLLQSSTTSWAEKYYQKTPIQFDNIIDIPGPVSLAMIAERTSGSELGLNLKGGKIAVFGDISWLSNRSFQSGANALLANETLNWILERHNLLNIPVRPHHQWQLPFRKQEVVRIFLYLFISPFIVGVLGLGIYAFRRK